MNPRDCPLVLQDNGKYCCPHCHRAWPQRVRVNCPAYGGLPWWKRHRGLGDTIEAVLLFFGIRKWPGCWCGRIQAWLNRCVAYHLDVRVPDGVHGAHYCTDDAHNPNRGRPDRESDDDHRIEKGQRNTNQPRGGRQDYLNDERCS